MEKQLNDLITALLELKMYEHVVNVAHAARNIATAEKVVRDNYVHLPGQSTSSEIRYTINGEQAAKLSPALDHIKNSLRGLALTQAQADELFTLIKPTTLKGKTNA